MDVAELQLDVPPQDAEPRPLSPIAPGPLTYEGNRVVIATRDKPPDTFRVAVVGDSMSYGAGLLYRRALSARLAHHLNAALPAWWVECISFGVSGACLHHAVGRVITHVDPIGADIVIVAVCRNDAFVLGQQPSDLAVVGTQWVSFRPLVRRSLAALKQAVASQGSRALVVYLDSLQHAGTVSIPDELSAACAAIGLPFVDGSIALVGYRPEDLAVSAVDGHLSALAHDLVARLVAQATIGLGLLPCSAGFDDGSWIDIIERGAHVRVRAGLAGATAFGEAIAVLDGKWHNRRNTNRQPFQPRYETARERLLSAQHTSLTRVAFAAIQEDLRAKNPLVTLWRVEMQASALMAASLVLQHAIAGDSQDEVLGNLDHLRHEDDRVPATLEESISNWEHVREAATRVQRTLMNATGCITGQESPDLSYLALWISRVSQWVRVVEECAARYLDLLPRLPLPLDAHRASLVAYVDVPTREFREKLTELMAVADALEDSRRRAALASGASHVTLNLGVSAAPGSEQWSMTIGLESTTPAFSERHVGTVNLIRDGERHPYEFDLPIILAGTVHIYMHGAGLSAGPGGVWLRAASLQWPVESARSPVLLPQPRLEAVSKDSAAVVIRIDDSLPVESQADSQRTFA